MSKVPTPKPAFGGFTLIVVLFILLVIVGATYC
ncbi:YjcZ family sporulation protein [Alkalihalobacterium alkalinitrilicum]|nr:YjcZ family sporulation protein [Alkalihalobacterium alkalinitrilicum]